LTDGWIRLDNPDGLPNGTRSAGCIPRRNFGGPFTLLERLAVRTSNPYGKAPEELSRILDDLEAVERLPRRIADHEIRTTIPLNEVVTAILRLVDA
jgi:hypothetical protein